jgi:acetyl esterase/lipase
MVSHDAATLDVPLWPGRTNPAMHVHLPEGDRSRPCPALVVFRGGGYARNNGSGGGSAAWAARHGLVGVEVDYGTRATQSFFPGPYADAARAVRLVRAHAKTWSVDPSRVGVIGYSAGGHLASLLSTQPSLWIAPEDDLAPWISARPDLVVLAYPLISFVEEATPGAFLGSVENFLGRADISDAERRQFSTELHVEATHPPVFLWTTADDEIVPAAHAERFADACQRAGVAVSFTMYPHGPHAMGLALDHPGDVGRWTTQLIAWLDRQRWTLPR